MSSTGDATLDAELARRSDRTAVENKALWESNAAVNSSMVLHQTQELWRDSNGKNGVLIAAGPSLRHSIAEIKGLDRKKHELVAVDMALPYLAGEGVYPDYVICSDASRKMVDVLSVPLPGAGLPLLLNVITHPDTARMWQGPIYWFCMMSNYYDGDAQHWMQDGHQQASKVSSFLMPGGNVSTLGLSFLQSIRACRRIMLYGHDFCWIKDGDFYAGNVHTDLAQERITTERKAGTVFAMQDVNGTDVYTNGSLMAFASWYEDIDRAMPGLLDNRTPTTILNTGGRTHGNA